ncbi:SDR family NAD(P)-dependent oxidoreductase [Alteromonas sp. CYL-A6]|uniref:SDR family NAD(P)-dependent oxidoreductase n=1 Tax=Alteromonas nitratireducens TaxID=3390813 RepID=UPI0034B59FF7
MQTTTTSRPVAVITGAASGLGLDLARQLAPHYDLILIDVQADALKQAAASLGGQRYFVCDLSEPTDITTLTQTLCGEPTRISVLINNAGITHRSLADKTQTQIIQKVMQINYLAPVQLTQELLPVLTDQACIVNISSMAGWMPVLGRAGYCASKSALHQYFETLRAEWHGNGKHILMVYPSFLATPIEQNALNGQGGRATHARSMVGALRSSEAMARQIVTAMARRQQRLLPDTFTRFSSLLYRLMPRVYLHLMRKRLASELEQDA